MLDLKNHQIVLQGNVHQITRWDVWFMTPYGVCATLEEALNATGNPNLVVPVPVARTAGDIYEVAAPH